MRSRLVCNVFSRALASTAFRLFLVLTIWLLTPPTLAQKKIEVDLALVLAVDVSHSVDPTEFRLQMKGLARALASQEVITAIEQGLRGRIAVMVVQWSGMKDQKITIPWTIVGDAVSARRVAGAIGAAPRMTEGVTSISAVIDFSAAQLAGSPVIAHRYVIDISADGVNNSGAPPMPARDRAVAAGITINGLTILNDVRNLNKYFIQNVAGGPGNFVMVADDYKAYGTAIKRKLLKEIGQLVS